MKRKFTKEEKEEIERRKLIRKLEIERKYVYNRLNRAFGKRMRYKPLYLINGKTYIVDVGIRCKKSAIDIKAPPNEFKEADFKFIGYNLYNLERVNRENVSRIIQSIKNIRL